jgi:hypothetical protein
MGDDVFPSTIDVAAVTEPSQPWREPIFPGYREWMQGVDDRVPRRQQIGAIDHVGYDGRSVRACVVVMSYGQVSRNRPR